MCDNAIVESVCCAVGRQEPRSTETEETLDAPSVPHSLSFLSVFVFKRILSRAETHFCLKHYFTFICCVCACVCLAHISGQEEAGSLSHQAGSKARTWTLRLTRIHLYSISLLTSPTVTFEAQVLQMCDLVLEEVKATAKIVAF